MVSSALPMPFASLARFLGFASFRRHRRRDGNAQRRRRGRRSRVQGVAVRNGVVHVHSMETSVDFDMQSHSSPLSMSASFYFTCSGARTDRLGRDTVELSMGSARSRPTFDPVEVAKLDQKKLRKAMERAMQQERKEARKMQKLVDKAARKRGSSNNRIALLSAGTVSDCSTTSDADILAEIWAMRSPTCTATSDDDLPEVDEDLSQSQRMEFLFFGGCPDDKNLHELEVGHRRLRSSPRAARYPPTPSYATTIPIKPTLVSKMPPLFAPRFNVSIG